MEQVVRLLQSVTLRHDLDHRLHSRECQLVLALPPVDGEGSSDYGTGGDLRSVLAEAQSAWAAEMPEGGRGAHPLGAKTQYLAEQLLEALADWHRERTSGGRQVQGLDDLFVRRHESCLQTIGIIQEDLTAISSLRPLSGSIGGDRDRQWLWLWRFSPGHTAGPELRRLVLEHWNESVSDRIRPPGMVVRVDRALQSAVVSAFAARKV